MLTDGKHILMDFYSCYYDILSDESTLTEIFTEALEESNFPTSEIACVALEDEFILSAFDTHRHVIMHIYPELGFVALDTFAYRNPIDAGLLSKILRIAFGAQRVKTTSVNRGDYGDCKDMKPRTKTKVTAKGRVKQTGLQLKKTGKTLKKTGIKVLHIVTGKKKKSE